eukprot:11028138-Ditylum_brightwellii.AAC.1
MTHNTKDCHELNWRKKHTKINTNRNGSDKVTYKDLNAFVNAKVTATLKKAKSQNKKERSKKVDSSNEESDPGVNALAAADNNDSDSNTSCLASKDSESNSE